MKKYWLLPLSWLYGAIISVRNALYDFGVLRSYDFDLAIVKIGNLSVGGTGKTPHTELVAAMLAEAFPSVAILSRGYKRRTKGFRLATEADNADSLGDEPYQMHLKLPGVQVAVCEDRKTGIEKLLQNNGFLSAVVLDDAYQHRKVKAGLNILLSDYNEPFFEDFLLPAGRLREQRSAFRRADLIIFTKAPARVNVYDKKYVYTKVGAAAHQQVIFSHIRYGEAVFLEAFDEQPLSKKMQVLLVTGIANAQPLTDMLDQKGISFMHMNFADHQRYKDRQLKRIKAAFEELPGDNKVVITTEKDFVKLREHAGWFEEQQIPLAYLPIEIGFDEHDRAIFIDKIEEYVKQYQRNR
ncbi:MAG: tetraacyldisaccharide 4'-kinase [Bacteroidia bacterium]